MKRYVVGQDRSQSTLFPESLNAYIAEDNPVRVVDTFVDELELLGQGFEGAEPVSKDLKVLERAVLFERAIDRQCRPARLKAGYILDASRWLHQFESFARETSTASIAFWVRCGGPSGSERTMDKVPEY
jgi:hypothetical protein